jgi:hypothetical protein
VVQNDDAAAPWLDLVQFPQLLEARRRLVLNVLDLRRQLRAVGLEARAQTRRREDPLWQACTKCLIFSRLYCGCMVVLKLSLSRSAKSRTGARILLAAQARLLLDDVRVLQQQLDQVVREVAAVVGQQLVLIPDEAQADFLLPAPETAVLACYAPVARMQQRHRKPIYCGERYGRAQTVVSACFCTSFRYSFVSPGLSGAH